jgi:hypothetical protein
MDTPTPTTPQLTFKITAIEAMDLDGTTYTSARGLDLVLDRVKRDGRFIKKAWISITLGGISHRCKLYLDGTAPGSASIEEHLRGEVRYLQGDLPSYISQEQAEEAYRALSAIITRIEAEEAYRLATRA